MPSTIFRRTVKNTSPSTILTEVGSDLYMKAQGFREMTPQESTHYSRSFDKARSEKLSWRVLYRMVASWVHRP
jgi:hypothetical protein